MESGGGHVSGNQQSLAELIAGFLDAENKRDWEAYRRCLAPDVECVTYGPEREVVQGREEYIESVRQMYAGRTATFTIEHLAANEERGGVFVEILMEGLRSVSMFKLENGLIHSQSEYLEDGYWKQLAETH